MKNFTFETVSCSGNKVKLWTNRKAYYAFETIGYGKIVRHVLTREQFKKAYLRALNLNTPKSAPLKPIQRVEVNYSLN